MTLSKKMYINGTLHSGHASVSIINPANDEVVGEVTVADGALALTALEAADAAYGSWSSTSISERVEWMMKLKAALKENETHLRECIHLEMGKSWASTQGDFEMLLDSLDFFASDIQKQAVETLEDKEGTHSHVLVRESVGVVAAFLAWNFPLLNLAYKLGPALASGCPIVVKPSLKTPLSALAVGEICQQIGLPPGVVNIVCGPDQEIGDAISSSPIPALLTLIGSTETGKHVMQQGATSIKRYSMELGGNAPVLIFDDADLDLAADIVCGLKFENAGQICVAPNRVFVHRDVADTFYQKVLARTQAVKVGFNRNEAIDMGPVIDQQAWQRIDGLVNDAVAKGAEVLIGSGRPEHLSKGAFYAPTVLKDVTRDAKIYREEVFGPVISILNFDDEAQVVKDANDTDAGLSSFIFTADEERAQRIAKRLRFGEVHVNGVKYAIHLPHCGVKQSGVGVDCSHLSLEEYFTVKRISTALGKGQA
jgi:succinate-semialdehyde dehydrogenase/glutarate-semialdehyde dehydrogenase